ncbi:sensorin-A-like [Littorina saxatilis]|uniref:EF-hand domain-containing protein n=1 Tax=Littorina saxatilis TaxID=31220 RepID=A0AAN9BVG6_9CAEN
MTMLRSAAIMAVFLAALCMAHTLSLGGARDEDEELGTPVKRDGRRITRDRYRMGYMFGKRSNLPDARLLIKTLTGKAIPVEQLSVALQSDQDLARRVARHLDRNGDGYVSVSELL